MSAVLRPSAPTLRPMTVGDLDAVLAIEARAYAFPWSRGNFIDSLAAGYMADVLVDERRAVVGYFIAMAGVDEMHLLNLTVAPEWQRRGHARAMLDVLVERARGAGARQLWLEVRASNHGARALYRGHGFVSVGVRRAYYPAAHARREDAHVMQLPLGGPRALD